LKKVQLRGLDGLLVYIWCQHSPTDSLSHVSTEVEGCGGAVGMMHTGVFRSDAHAARLHTSRLQLRQWAVFLAKTDSCTEHVSLLLPGKHLQQWDWLPVCANWATHAWAQDR
jgi:hypothetical protein